MTTNTFAGKPIIGTPNRYTDQTKSQRPESELKLLITEVWDDPNMDIVECFTWEQYTPMFNDGDACIFGVSEVYLILKDRHDKFADKYGFNHPEDDAVGLSPWDVSQYMLDRYPENAQYKPLLPAMKALGEICSGEFNVVLNSVFGDPARVVVYRDRIVLDEYFEAPY